MAPLHEPWLVQTGAVELAVGALSGWLVAASVDQPGWLKRAGVRAPPRLRQAHLDWIIMGLILIALGLAAPHLPLAIAVPLAVGAWVNPTLFIPLAFAPDVSGRLLYRAVSGASFVLMSGGATAAAVDILCH